nr:unnamed protein product [Callosobruchus chinensis]
MIDGNYNVVIISRTSEGKFINRPTITRPTGVRIQETPNRIDSELPNTYKVNSNETPPWIIKKPKLYLDCAMYKKKDTNPTTLLQTFLNIINTYEDAQEIIYTDGSKTDTGVGYAYVCNNTENSNTSNPVTSIFNAEMYALSKALKYI